MAIDSLYLGLRWHEARATECDLLGQHAQPIDDEGLATTSLTQPAR